MTANVLRGVSITLLMSPTAYHRLRCGASTKSDVADLEPAAIGGLLCLALAIGGAAFLIADVLFGTASAAATGIATATLLGGLWFVLPLTREAKDRRTGSDD